MTSVTTEPVRDPAGRALVVGCRVHVPPRVHGNPYALAETVGVEDGSPSVGGRITKIYQGKRGMGADIRGYGKQDYGLRTVPLNLCRVQQGDTQEEVIARAAGVL